jgi:hypothetical protein
MPSCLDTRLLLGLWLALACSASAAEQAVAPTPHAFLERLCDDFGGRLTGSAANERALARLEEELSRLGLRPIRQAFTMPGWERGADRVDLVTPLARPLRVAALGYTEAHAPFTAAVVDLGLGRPEDIPGGDLKGRVGLLASGSALLAPEIVARSLERGLRGVLFINREGGGQLLARTGSQVGSALPLPIYSIAQEEGRWIQRLLARGSSVQVRIETRSRCRTVETANVSVLLPGRTPSRVIIGAHFDSWDLGQGAMDNGIGIAQLFALAESLRGRQLNHTVELVWFNGEEQGLWGSRAAAARLGATPVVAMLNLDMVGVPVGVNALGCDALVPVLEAWHRARGEAGRLPKGVQNINWIGSDHTPYQLAGVRCLTFDAPLPRETARHYHDVADTIDKVSPALLADSIATVTSLVIALAEDPALTPARLGTGESRELFTRFGLEKRLRTLGLWTFAEETPARPVSP